MTPENVHKIKKSLLEIFDDKSIEEIKADDLENYAVIRYGTPENFYIDIIGRIGKVATYRDVSQDIEVYEISGVKIPVCGIKTLIKIKQTVRPKDRMDLEFLREKLKQRQKRGEDSNRS